MAKTPEQFTTELKDLYGDNLVAVVLYGSAATGEYVEKVSDFNLLVVLTRITPADLRAGTKVIRTWVKAGNPPPLMFTRDRLRESADVFPMEIADIQEHHRMLFGENPVEGVVVSPADLRLELERELKAKLIQTRETYLKVAGSDRDVRELLVKSSSTFLTLFRHALRLHGVSPLPAKRAAARELAGVLPFDATVFDDVIALRETGKLPGGAKPDAVMDRYLPVVERVVDAVNELVHESKAS